MSRPKFGRRPKRYVHPDEIKLRDQAPADGQPVAVRMFGNKTYFACRYEAAEQFFRFERNTEHGISGEHAMGWLPQLSHSPRDGDRRFLACWCWEVDGIVVNADEPKATLKDALRRANESDRSCKGRVIEQVFTADDDEQFWRRVAEYNEKGELV